MAGRHLTLRLPEASLEHLDREARHSGQTRSELARALIEEGLRMREHPGIVFRPGPMGRRAGLSDGPDVWEAVELFLQIGVPGEKGVALTSKRSSLRPDQVRRALRYYSDYPAEVDEKIERNREAAERGYAEWLSEQSLTA